MIDDNAKIVKPTPGMVDAMGKGRLVQTQSKLTEVYVVGEGSIIQAAKTQDGFPVICVNLNKADLFGKAVAFAFTSTAKAKAMLGALDAVVREMEGK